MQHLKTCLAGGVLLLGTSVTATSITGGGVAITSYTIDGGGGRSAGGAFELHGTIGQHDAGGPAAGGVFELNAGFWSGGAIATACPADCGTDDGIVDVADLLAQLGDWGAGGPCDLNGDGVTDVQDMLALLGAWGVCP